MSPPLSAQQERDLEDLYAPPPRAPALTQEEVRRRLKDAIKGRWCKGCSRKPRVFFESGGWQIRCDCYPAVPNFGPAPKWMNEKEQLMLETTDERGLVPLSTSGRAMNVAEYQERERLIAYVVSQMKPDVHYGQIPGTRGKTLYEAGAEHLRAAFNINWSYEVEERLEDDSAEVVKVRVRAWHIIGVTPAGPIRGSAWEATCSSREPKLSGFPYAELMNVVADRAVKRAFVNLMKNVTGASGLFKDAAVNADDQPAQTKDVGPMQWLTHCPEHNVKWRPPKDPKYSPSHLVPGKSVKDGKEAWCNQWPLINRLVTERTKAAGALMGIDEKAVSKRLLDLSGSAKWAEVSPGDRVKALMALETEADEKASVASMAAQDADATPAPAKPLRSFRDLAEFRKAAEAIGVNERGLVEIVGPVDALKDLSAAWAKVEATRGE